MEKYIVSCLTQLFIRYKKKLFLHFWIIVEKLRLYDLKKEPIIFLSFLISWTSPYTKIQFARRRMPHNTTQNNIV
jgi:hypothetical protein